MFILCQWHMRTRTASSLPHTTWIAILERASHHAKMSHTMQKFHILTCSKDPQPMTTVTEISNPNPWLNHKANWYTSHSSSPHGTDQGLDSTQICPLLSPASLLLPCLPSRALLGVLPQEVPCTRISISGSASRKFVWVQGNKGINIYWIFSTCQTPSNYYLSTKLWGWKYHSHFKDKETITARHSGACLQPQNS